MIYKYTVFGKEKGADTGIHPISTHFSMIGAICSFIRLKIKKAYTDLYIS